MSRNQKRVACIFVSMVMTPFPVVSFNNVQPAGVVIAVYNFEKIS